MISRTEVNEDSPFFDDEEFLPKKDQSDPYEVPIPNPNYGKATLRRVAHVAASLVGTDRFGIPVTEIQHYACCDTGNVWIDKLMRPYMECAGRNGKRAVRTGKDGNVEVIDGGVERVVGERNGNTIK
jgi:hypothetical protein